MNKSDRSPDLKADASQEKVDQITANVEKFGYAVAMLEQLGSDLVRERLAALGLFCTEYLHTKTHTEALKSIDSKDVMEILLEGLMASSNYFALVGPIKKVLDVWDEKRLPKAGFKPGDTDILFELDDLLEQDARRSEQILTAVSEVKRHAEALRMSVGES